VNTDDRPMPPPTPLTRRHLKDLTLLGQSRVAYWNSKATYTLHQFHAGTICAKVW